MGRPLRHAGEAVTFVRFGARARFQAVRPRRVKTLKKNSHNYQSRQFAGTKGRRGFYCSAKIPLETTAGEDRRFGRMAAASRRVQFGRLHRLNHALRESSEVNAVARILVRRKRSPRENMPQCWRERKGNLSAAARRACAYPPAISSSKARWPHRLRAPNGRAAPPGGGRGALAVLYFPVEGTSFPLWAR